MYGRSGDLAPVFFGECGDAEVSDAYLAVLVEHDVCRFQIAMQHTALVHGCETCTKLARHFDSFVLWQPADALQERRELFAANVLHRDEVLALVFGDVVNAADVSM